jgi:molybdopterin synthase sulfur carrier subunit
MIDVHLRYFASIREVLGCASEEWKTGASTVGALRIELVSRGDVFQCLAVDKPVRMALNQVMCQPSDALTPGCEVGFFPPVTGG